MARRLDLLGRSRLEEEFQNFTFHFFIYLVLRKVIIEKSRGEVSVMKQDTIVDVS